MWRLGLGAVATAALPSLKGSLRADSETTIRQPAGPIAWPIALDSNANAYGPSARTMAALQESLTRANRVPDDECENLRDRVAAFHRVARERVVLGCGSSEILRIAVRAFTGSGRGLVTALPTYELIGRCAAREGVPVAAVHLASDWSHDLQGMLAQCGPSTGLVYICNPNNPSGSLTRRADLEAFLRRLPSSVTVLIDEAYHHYVEPSSDYRSFIDDPVEDPRVIVVRTFSKIYGLAGLRVGYAIASPRMAGILTAQALDRNVNVLAAKGAIAALDDVDHVQRSSSLNADDRQEFLNQANARMLRSIDSQTNFVMMGSEHPVGTIVEKPAVEAIVEHFARNNIVLPAAFAPLNQYVRVSLGTAAEMSEFWRVWDLMPGHKM